MLISAGHRPWPVSRGRVFSPDRPTSAPKPASGGDRLRFAASLQLAQPTTIAESRLINERVTLRRESLVEDLLARLDEAMTVAGEAYCKKEAFTTLIDLHIRPEAWRKPQGAFDSRVETQVEHTMNAGGKRNVGIMVVSSKADDMKGQPVADVSATFNAIEPVSVGTDLNPSRLFGLLEKLVRYLKPQSPLMPHTQTAQELEQALDALRPPKAMIPAPVQELAIAPSEQALNGQAEAWNRDLSAYYKKMAARYHAKDPQAPAPNLAQTAGSATRLVNSSIYVRPDMLNKKRTGHGGVAAANAVQDMLALVGKSAARPEDLTVERISANYLAPFTMNDALQFETTVDHVTPQNEVFLSTRLYKFDTKAQRVEGPVILVNAKLKGSPVSLSTAGEPDAGQRRKDALEWEQTRRPG